MDILTFKKEDSLKIKTIICLIWICALLQVVLAFTIVKVNIGSYVSLGIFIFMMIISIGLILKSNIARKIVIVYTYLNLFNSIATLGLALYGQTYNSKINTLNTILVHSNGIVIAYYILPIIIIYLFSNKETKIIYSKGIQ